MARLYSNENFPLPVVEERQRLRPGGHNGDCLLMRLPLPQERSG